MPKFDQSDSSGLTETRRSAFSSLRHRDFRLLWAGQIVSVIGSQMQSAAINWHIYLLTGSPLALGMVGFFVSAPSRLSFAVGRTDRFGHRIADAETKVAM